LSADSLQRRPHELCKVVEVIRTQRAVAIIAHDVLQKAIALRQRKVKVAVLAGAGVASCQIGEFIHAFGVVTEAADKLLPKRVREGRRHIARRVHDLEKKVEEEEEISA
jgi:hypothetical protein